LKISIIIPCHKFNDIVNECIESLYCQKKNHEILIGCDNFYWDSEKDIKFIISNNKLFANGIRNFAAKYASGDYFLFIDSDIIVENNFIYKLENYIKSNNVEILNFPTRKEKSKNIFANYKGIKENYQTVFDLPKKKNKKPFFGYAVLFKKNVFLDLGGWPEGRDLDYIMEHEGFQKKIFQSKYLNEVANEIQVDHYHHKNLYLFKNIIFRTSVWIKKKLRKEVEFDQFKSIKNSIIALGYFLILTTTLASPRLSASFGVLTLLMDIKFLLFLLKRTGLFFLLYFIIHIIFNVCIILGVFIGFIEYYFSKLNFK
jgi:glycosyltransferase involved in cell wall biosynthesis